MAVLMQRARRSRLILAGLAPLLGLTALSLAAPLLAPWAPSEQLDPAAGALLAPGSSKEIAVLTDGRRLLADEIQVRDEGLLLRRLGKEQILPFASVLEPRAGEPARKRTFLLGTDRFGRDLWSRLLYGARVSLMVGTLAAALSLIIGLLVGSFAALSGGLLDTLTMRLADALLMFPRLFLVLAVTALMHSGTATVILVLAATGWMGASRLARSQILELRQREFVVAARATGLSTPRILVRHLLPNAWPPLLVDTALRVGDIILLEATLSFLGMGIQPPVPSWGNMVAEGSEVLASAWWVAAFPGLAIALTVIGFGLLADGLRDVLDPRTRSFP